MASKRRRAAPHNVVCPRGRANVEFFDAPLGQDRAEFTGTIEQIADDVVAARKIGATEILFDVHFSPDVKTLDDILARIEHIWQIAKQT